MSSIPVSRRRSAVGRSAPSLAAGVLVALCLLPAVAAAQADEGIEEEDGPPPTPIIKVDLDGNVTIRLNSPFEDCKARFFPSGYDSNVLRIDGVSDAFTKFRKWRLNGLQQGTSPLTVNWEIDSGSECGFSSGSFPLQINVGYPIRDLTRDWRQLLRDTRIDVRDLIKEEGQTARSELRWSADLLKQNFLGEIDGSIKYYLEHAFEALLCAHFHMISDSTYGLMDARDTGQSWLTGNSVDELCKGPAFSDGECNAWDKASGAFANDVRRALGGLAREEKRFYRAVERYTDLNITGVHRYGEGVRMPGPRGYDQTLVPDPQPRLRILNAWAVGGPAGLEECVVAWIGGMGFADEADGGGNQVRVILDLGNGGSIEKTVSMDGYGKWWTYFDEKDGLTELQTTRIRAEYFAPDPGEEDFDELYLSLRAQIRLDF